MQNEVVNFCSRLRNTSGQLQTLTNRILPQFPTTAALSSLSVTETPMFMRQLHLTERFSFNNDIEMPSVL